MTARRASAIKPPFDLTPKEAGSRDKLDLSTPLDFVTTGDIIGGNSGSPVVNRDGELVGLIFDGNIESLAGDFVYDGAKNRAVAVHSSGMIEGLRKLYGADALADELQGKRSARYLHTREPIQAPLLVSAIVIPVRAWPLQAAPQGPRR